MKALETPVFVEPAFIREDPKAFAAWTRSMEVAKQAYRDVWEALKAAETKLAVEMGPKEASRFLRTIARSVLPNATETKIVLTANARALRSFLELRGGIPGDPEMRLVAAELFKVLQTEAPALFSDFELVLTVLHCSGFSPSEYCLWGGRHEALFEN